MSLRAVFDGIYQRNEWNGTETRSGPGSGDAATRRIRQALIALVAELGITSVIDAACGEGYWQPDLPNYLGIDVSQKAIERAEQHHPDRWYRVQDVRKACPRGDLVLCRDAMQHVSLEDGQKILSAIRASGSRWLLASTYVCSENVDVRAGGYYSPNLTEPPFDLGPPLRLIPDGFDYADPDRVRDPRKMLGLWQL